MSAPASSALTASSRDLIPHILTVVIASYLASCQFSYPGSNVRCGHERLPDQDRVDIGGCQSMNIRCGGDAGFGNNPDPGRDERAEPFRCLEGYSERREIPVVDPDQVEALEP